MVEKKKENLVNTDEFAETFSVAFSVDVSEVLYSIDKVVIKGKGYITTEFWFDISESYPDESHDDWEIVADIEEVPERYFDEDKLLIEQIAEDIEEVGYTYDEISTETSDKLHGFIIGVEYDGETAYQFNSIDKRFMAWIEDEYDVYLNNRMHKSSGDVIITVAEDVEKTSPQDILEG